MVFRVGAIIFVDLLDFFLHCYRYFYYDDNNDQVGATAPKSNNKTKPSRQRRGGGCGDAQAAIWSRVRVPRESSAWHLPAHPPARGVRGQCAADLESVLDWLRRNLRVRYAGAGERRSRSAGWQLDGGRKGEREGPRFECITFTICNF